MGDAATVIPWQLYMTYGKREILAEQYASMRAWVDYITRSTTTPGLWAGDEHYGDWLGLDAPQGSFKGSSREDFIASAFYAYSTEPVIRAGRVPGEGTGDYEALHARIVSAFHRAYPEYLTQTECVLALHFCLAEDETAAADRLCQLIRQAGRMETGFAGTPYLLHVLSAHGHTDFAYRLLREAYPSWLYAVGKGATTVRGHWDGILEGGTFWPKDMNSFNHYACGSVIDWVYERAAGIRPAGPGFARVTVAPEPTDALAWLEASIDTPHGRVSSRWARADGRIRYEITLPVPGEVVIDGEARMYRPGSYILWGKREG
ncbi:MAG: alpha-L-rhamnosidase C-terminal domain-containing protein [Aristaeellaceae bacterium]